MNQELKTSPSVIEIIKTSTSIITALGILFLLFALLSYSPQDRVETLALATQQAVENISTVVSTEPITIKDGEVIERDTQCLWIDVVIDGIRYSEFQVGYLIPGDIVGRTGRTHLNFVEVLVDSTSRLSKYTNTCWIKD